MQGISLWSIHPSVPLSLLPPALALPCLFTSFLPCFSYHYSIVHLPIHLYSFLHSLYHSSIFPPSIPPTFLSFSPTQLHLCFDRKHKLASRDDSSLTQGASKGMKSHKHEVQLYPLLWPKIYGLTFLFFGILFRICVCKLLVLTVFFAVHISY